MAAFLFPPMAARSWEQRAKGWRGAMSLRWPSRRRERFWREPITASSRWRARRARKRRFIGAAQHDSEHAGEDGTETHYGKRVNVEKQVKGPARDGGRVYALDLSGDAGWPRPPAAAIPAGIKGASWQGGPVMGVGRLSVGGRARSADGRGPEGWSGSLHRRRRELDADGHSGRC
jgi:hypothetical protein